MERDLALENNPIELEPVLLTARSPDCAQLSPSVTLDASRGYCAHVAGSGRAQGVKTWRREAPFARWPRTRLESHATPPIRGYVWRGRTSRVAEAASQGPRCAVSEPDSPVDPRDLDLLRTEQPPDTTSRARVRARLTAVVSMGSGGSPGSQGPATTGGTRASSATSTTESPRDTIRTHHPWRGLSIQ
jgi:hypothetical protein